MAQTPRRGLTYIVEHLDPDLGPWSELEYITIAKESHAAGNTFCLSSLPPDFQVPPTLASEPAFKSDSRSVEDLYKDKKERERVCLLDPAAAKDLSPGDGETFDVFLFGGILGMTCFDFQVPTPPPWLFYEIIHLHCLR